MTHKDAAKYAVKHPGKKLDERIALRIKGRCADSTISCAEAHRIAGELGIVPADVGIAMDLLEVRLKKCQLGLFGYDNKKKLVPAAGGGDPEIIEAIEMRLVDGRLPCAAAWEIAEKFGLAKIGIAGMCEAMKIKISSCQLGAFRQ